MRKTTIEHRIIFNDEQIALLNDDKPCNMYGLYLQRESLDQQHKDSLEEVFHNYTVEISDGYSLIISSEGSYHLKLGADWRELFSTDRERVIVKHAYSRNDDQVFFNHEISFMHVNKLKESLVISD